MTRRVICGWCPVELPDDADEWRAHFLIDHAPGGYSVRFYPMLSEADEMAALLAGEREAPA